jgi:hypothetical protein
MKREVQPTVNDVLRLDLGSTEQNGLFVLYPVPGIDEKRAIFEAEWVSIKNFCLDKPRVLNKSIVL